MTNEQNKTLKALQIAIRMEIDGREYYVKTSRASSNELGKKLLQSLAIEEDTHRQKFEEIYNTLQGKKDWPVVNFQPDGGKRLRTIFAKAIEEISPHKKTPDTELNAIQIALDLENKTYDFYKSQSEIATYDAEMEFYQAVATEEREHHIILLDYYEYLKNPSSWFVTKEHPSLDAG